MAFGTRSIRHWVPMRIARVADFQRCRHHAGMIALTDHQLATVMDAAAALAPERRDIFLERIAALLAFRAHTDADVADVVKLAMAGLIQQSA